MNVTITVAELKDLHDTMTAKGYLLVGLKPDGLSSMALLVIHKDWKVFNMGQFFDQAYNDLPERFKDAIDFAMEIPTLAMFEKQYENKHHGFMIIVDKRMHN